MRSFLPLPGRSLPILLLLSIVLLVCPQSLSAADDIPTSYTGLKTYYRNYKDGAKTIRGAILMVRQLPPAEDSLDMLAGEMLKLVERLTEDPYLPMIACQTLSTTYYATYTNMEKSMTYARKELDYIVKQKVDSYYLYEAYAKLCFIYLETNKLDSAILCAKKTEAALPEIKKPEQRAILYRQLSVFYSQARMYERAEFFARAGLASNEKNNITLLNHSFYSTLSLIKELHMAPADTIIAYQKKALYYAELSNAQEQMGVYYRNLGMHYSNSNRRDSAEKYFGLAFRYFEEVPYQYGQMQLSLEYARHLINFSEYEKAKTAVDSLHQVVDSGDYYTESVLYLLKFRLALREGDIRLAESYIASRDSLLLLDFSEGAQKAKEEMATRFETEKKESENLRLQTENRQYRSLWIIAVVLVLALVSVLVLFILNRKKEKALAEKEAENLLLLNREKQIELEAKEAENRRLQRELKDSIERVLQQQATGQHLLSKVEELKEEQNNPILKRKTIHIQQLVKSQYSEDLLHEIEEKAKIAYPELLQFLQENLADRNRIETLYCLMVVMGYSPEEIMTLSQRSEKALKSMRYRIRKRLELDDAISLSGFLKTKAGTSTGLRSEENIYIK